MTPRELPKYEELFSFRFLLSFSGQGGNHSAGRAHPILKTIDPKPFRC
uniref:Uncharacterized protein n=1 Tax=Utricularia reniformis TaxID=192314 RepID=A0A1Y0B1D4_9LAMI|nr:hypothetical protein AEK19_MT0945 [Utricularia reniformis]ART31169.1 hypothetical protein AEK19_MT0945 [Utricularia reniformis]